VKRSSPNHWSQRVPVTSLKRGDVFRLAPGGDRYRLLNSQTKDNDVHCLNINTKLTCFHNKHTTVILENRT
jgi:hypothetical protein